jgi:hypothetical protein
LSTNPALTELEYAFERACGAGDIATLAPLLAVDFRYTHTAGQTQRRDEFLAGLARRVGLRDRRLDDLSVEVHHDLAVTHGTLTISYPTARADHHLRYVRLYRRHGARWHLIFHRTFEAPDLAPAPPAPSRAS